ncbi:type 1 glutamine amidotransferase [Neptunicella marina]|uniref:Type 1 glutamine amidotransferase n=1 Tax=Neptunicella marina TaxID=2125989 RepID=A0A8J6IWW0_9ALTE|nr:type 1 glutamine amidotransferase [Neptunicella marina]MBC3767055.1 type 1 glutamine amidotransferase [Neptunicella marina]
MQQRVCYLQHVPFEGLGSIADTLAGQGCSVQKVALYENSSLPDIEQFDCLIVMGGPMSIHDEKQYPWLATEKQLISQAIAADKKVFGICLGAQLIASVLGAEISANPYKEIGWHDIRLTAEAELTWLAELLPATMSAFHWHGETFSLPGGAVAVATSEACLLQGFLYLDKVVALQFHLESTQQSVKQLIQHCGHELDGSAYVQNAGKMLASEQQFKLLNQQMDHIIRHWLSL